MKDTGKLNRLYDAEYFSGRMSNDKKRLLSFKQESIFIKKFSSFKGTCLDIGCSTGEFLTEIGWEGQKYGLEISNNAAQIAKATGIEIVKSYNVENSLDTIFYRGTIQHLDSPFRSIERAAETLKPHGKLFFIATPNCDSPVFKNFGTLPALDPGRNFYIPGRASLINVCKLYGLNLIGEEFPYWNSPYSNPLKDHYLFATSWILSLFLKRPVNVQFAFWKSMMNLVFSKNG